MQIDRDKPWADPANWHMVMPNLGRSCHLPLLESAFAQAQEKGEEEIRRWSSQHLNVEIGLALHSDRWRGADYWEGAADPELTLDELVARSEVAVVGGDAGGLDDLFGLAVAGRDRETRDWLFWFHAWCHRDVLERRKDIAPRLMDFEQAGTLTICEDATQDVDEFTDVVESLNAAGLLPKTAAVGLDPQGVGALLDRLAEAGIADEQITGIAQGYRLSSAVWSMERKLSDGTLRHDGSAMMAWCVGNAKAEQKGNAVYITKATAGKAKIDPLIAGFNAAKLLERNPLAVGHSVYRERGALVM
jgi:phage terminase large subunit-like protein